MTGFVSLIPAILLCEYWLLAGYSCCSNSPELKLICKFLAENMLAYTQTLPLSGAQSKLANMTVD